MKQVTKPDSETTHQMLEAVTGDITLDIMNTNTSNVSRPILKILQLENAQ